MAATGLKTASPSHLRVDCYRPGCYCTLDHQVEQIDRPSGFQGRSMVCPRCNHHRLVIGRLRGDL